MKKSALKKIPKDFYDYLTNYFKPHRSKYGNILDQAIWSIYERIIDTNYATNKIFNSKTTTYGWSNTTIDGEYRVRVNIIPGQLDIILKTKKFYVMFTLENKLYERRK